MREILFRGKRIRPDKDTGIIEWVYGLYMTVYGTPNIELEDGRECDVDAETVGQYTGLTDKNGTKIFEGDIVKKRSNYSGNTIIAVVTYSDACFLAMVNNNSGFGLDGCKNIEVIGNIHDNPELLEGGADK